MISSDLLKSESCKGDFLIKFEEALVLCGGAPNIDYYLNLPLKDIVEILPQNGIRLTYNANWHMKNHKEW